MQIRTKTTPRGGRCPDCGTQLNTETIVKLKNGNKIDIVGYYQFCPEMNCNFEVDIESPRGFN